MMKGLLSFGVVGTVVAALCCAGIMTPLLVGLLTVVGLGALTAHLDAVLLPALIGFAVLSFCAYRRLQPRPTPERATPANPERSTP